MLGIAAGELHERACRVPPCSARQSGSLRRKELRSNESSPNAVTGASHSLSAARAHEFHASDAPDIGAARRITSRRAELRSKQLLGNADPAARMPAMGGSDIPPDDKLKLRRQGTAPTKHSGCGMTIRRHGPRSAEVPEKRSSRAPSIWVREKIAQFRIGLRNWTNGMKASRPQLLWIGESLSSRATRIAPMAL